MSRNGMPGPGGSLGQCAFCGKPFVLEILSGANVETFSIGQVAGQLYAHKACMTKYGHCETILEWPEASPVRQAILSHNERFDAHPAERKDTP